MWGVAWTRFVLFFRISNDVIAEGAALLLEHIIKR